MNSKILGAAVIAALSAALISGCGSTSRSGTGGGVPKVTSSAAMKAEAEARAYFAPCTPKTAAAQVKLVTGLVSSPSATWQNLMTECGVPKQDAKAAATCALGNVEKAGKLPSGISNKIGVLMTDAYPCAIEYRSGATPAASSSMAATPAIPGIKS